ncbi:MAG: hypothetical protein OEO82_14180, partial [Gammaproteobacteria bacterium]|nr:hypothetical protein [Gammaproteobacteria bacterium]
QWHDDSSPVFERSRHSPLQSSQPPPLRPPQLPLIGLRPAMTPTLIAAITAAIVIKLKSIMTSNVIVA